MPIKRGKKRRKAGRAAVTSPTREAAEAPLVREVPAGSVWRWASWGILTALAMLAIAAWSTRRAPSDRVWNADHGHYHDIMGNELPPERAAGPAPAQLDATPVEKRVDLGEVPWQDQPTLPVTKGVLPPPGPPPPGKVWSSQHGHWHDDPNASPPPTKAVEAAPAPLLPPESLPGESIP